MSSDRFALSSVACARCRALLTDAVVVSIASATSAAFQRSTSRRISTARWRAGRCCRAATNASRIVSRSVTTASGSSALPVSSIASGTGSSQGISPFSSSGSAGLGGRGAQPGGQRAAVAALERGQADVGGDAVEPGAHRRPALEAVVGPPGAQVGLLDEVLGVVHRPGHPVAVRQQLAAVGVGDLGKVRRSLPVLCCGTVSVGTVWVVVTSGPPPPAHHPRCGALSEVQTRAGRRTHRSPGTAASLTPPCDAWCDRGVNPWGNRTVVAVGSLLLVTTGCSAGSSGKTAEDAADDLAGALTSGRLSSVAYTGGTPQQAQKLFATHHRGPRRLQAPRRGREGDRGRRREAVDRPADLRVAAGGQRPAVDLRHHRAADPGRRRRLEGGARADPVATRG